jgi:hypothetical protein
VWTEKANVSEPLMNCRKRSNDIETRSIIQKSTIEWRVDDLSDGHLAVFT